MRKWKARLREARVDKKIHGSKHEREVSAEIDAALRFWDPTVCRRRKFLPLDVIVLGPEPSITLLMRRLKEATEEEPKPAETKKGVSSSQYGHDSQKSTSELEKQTIKDREGCRRTFVAESRMLAHCASELLAIKSASVGSSSTHHTEIDLIAASYLLRLVSQSTEDGSGLSWAGALEVGSPSLSQQHAQRPSIESTLITAPQKVTYSLHNVSTDHDPGAKYLAPYLSTARHALITIDLACIADIDTYNNQPKMLTTLGLFKSMVEGWNGCRPSRLDNFLVFTNVEQLNHELSSAEHKLGPETLMNVGSKVHKTSAPLLDNAAYIYQYLNSLFTDVEPEEVAVPPNAPPTAPKDTPTDPSSPSTACRATLHYILSRFRRVSDYDVVSFYPCLIDTKDNTSLQRFWSSVNDVVISEALQICYCFGTTPSAEDRGPPPGQFNF